jgi:enterochelin esterase family protein
VIEIKGRQVTFIPPAEAQYLIGDFSDWQERPLPISGPLTLEFPPGAYVEYAFLDRGGRPFADPDNPKAAQNPWWTYPRAIELPGFSPELPPLVGELKGKAERYRLPSRALGQERTLYVYEPPAAPQATIFIQDGIAYYRLAKMPQIAEALWQQGIIEPVRLVFIEPKDRDREYWFNPAYEEFLVAELVPWLDSQYGPTSERGLWGASLGGLVSLWLAWRHPQLFSKVATNSACLTAAPNGGDAHHDPEWLTEQFAHSSRIPARFYLETGTVEWLLAPNRRFAAMLADLGYLHHYRERPSGHNWMTWRQGLAPGLSYLFPRQSL